MQFYRELHADMLETWHTIRFCSDVCGNHMFSTDRRGRSKESDRTLVSSKLISGDDITDEMKRFIRRLLLDVKAKKMGFSSYDRSFPKNEKLADRDGFAQRNRRGRKYVSLFDESDKFVTPVFRF